MMISSPTHFGIKIFFYSLVTYMWRFPDNISSCHISDQNFFGSTFFVFITLSNSLLCVGNPYIQSGYCVPLQTKMTTGQKLAHIGTWKFRSFYTHLILIEDFHTVFVPEIIASVFHEIVKRLWKKYFRDVYFV